MQTLKTLSPITVSTAGTRVTLSSTSPHTIDSVVIQADPSNAGNIFVGDVSVSSTNGIVLTPGQTFSIDTGTLGGNYLEINLNTIYVDAATSGDKVRITFID